MTTNANSAASFSRSSHSSQLSLSSRGQSPVIAMIAAMARGRVIGRDNRMPWHLPADLGFFKRVTMGKPVIMGRRTFDSIGRPLPGRLNIVITRDADWRADGVTVVNGPEQALTVALQQSEAQEIMVIGGGTIYQWFLPRAQRLYITEIELQIDSWDTRFPDYQAAAEWRCVAQEHHQADERNPCDYCFKTLERVASADSAEQP